MNKINQLEATAQQLFECGNIELVDQVFAEAYIAHESSKEYRGREFVKQFIGKIRTAIPDIKIVKIEILAQSDNTITWQRTLCGTHKQKFQGIPASLKRITWNEIVVTKFEADMIAEEWIVSNLAFSLMIQQAKK